MPLAMTEQMRTELDELGYTVLESFIAGAELQRIQSAAQAFAAEGSRRDQDGGVAEIALEMMDYEPLLPYLVDAMGWNIHMRDGLETCRAPASGEPGDTTKLGSAWHIDQQEEFRGLTTDGSVPLMELKISYYLSDARREGHACTLLVPGSHRWTPQQRATWEEFTQPSDVVPLRVPPGSVLLWRSTMLHGVTPHHDREQWRLHLMYSYVPRWFRPSFRGAFKNITNDPALLQRSSPIRRQLLGAMGDLSEDGMPLNSPLYLFPQTEEQVPLKAWAEERQAEQFIPGITGHGASNSNALNRHPSPTMHANSVMHEEYNRQGAWREAQCVSPPPDESPSQARARGVALELEVKQLRAQLEALQPTTASSKL